MHELQPFEDWIKECSLELTTPPIIMGYGDSIISDQGIQLRILSGNSEIWKMKSGSVASMINPPVVFYVRPSSVTPPFTTDTTDTYAVWLTRAATRIATRSRRGMGNHVIPCRSGMLMIYMGNSLADSPALYDHEAEEFIVNHRSISEYCCFMPGNPAEMYREFTKVLKKNTMTMHLVKNGYV